MKPTPNQIWRLKKGRVVLIVSAAPDGDLAMLYNHEGQITVLRTTEYDLVNNGSEYLGTLASDCWSLMLSEFLEPDEECLISSTPIHPAIAERTNDVLVSRGMMSMETACSLLLDRLVSPYSDLPLTHWLTYDGTAPVSAHWRQLAELGKARGYLLCWESNDE